MHLPSRIKTLGVLFLYTNERLAHTRSVQVLKGGDLDGVASDNMRF